MKPENLLLYDKSPRSLVKICDFGLSKMVNSNDRKHSLRVSAMPATVRGEGGVTCELNDQQVVMKSRVGTFWYASPELITKADQYNQKIDIWGLGLIVYIMLSGTHPFEGSMDAYGDITGGRITFTTSPQWASVSDEAKRFVRSLLRADPAQRPSAVQIQKDLWLTDGIAEDVQLTLSMAYLRRFTVTNLQDLGFKMLANQLTVDELQDARTLFDSLDEDQKGYLNAHDLRRALKGKVRPMTAKYDTHVLLQKVLQQAMDESGVEDKRKTDRPAHGARRVGVVTMEMFISAILQEDDDLVHRHLEDVFEAMDVDGSGVITVNDLKHVLQGLGIEMDADQISTLLVAEGDIADEPTLNYSSFLKLMLDRTRECRNAECRNAAASASSAAAPAAEGSGLATHGSGGS